MKTCTGCLAEKPLDGFYRDKNLKDGHSYYCKECVKQLATIWYLKNKTRPDRAPARTAEQIRAVDRARSKAKWVSMTEEARETKREAFRRWSAKYPEKVRQRSRLREARAAHQKPRWAKQSLMNDIYRLATIATRETGIQFTVDHIVPLKSRLVCGLHVEHNLTILEASANFKKGNKFWPDMP
jgi:hypothetical protein